MGGELQAKLAVAAEALRRLCRLSAEQWASREQLFGPANDDDQEWQLRVLKKLSSEKVIEAASRRADRVPIFRMARDGDKFRALGVLSGIIDDPSLISSLIEPPRRSEPPQQIRRPAPIPPRPPSRMMLEISGRLYERLATRAEARGMTIKAYLLALLDADGVRAD